MRVPGVAGGLGGEESGVVELQSGGQPEDVVRTRIYMTDTSQWEAVADAHRKVFRETLPANTLIGISDLVGGYLVEIEAEAELAR